ncbi:MAG: Flp pilus assembly protein CpaB [Bradymonadaceae bacterium]
MVTRKKYLNLFLGVMTLLIAGTVLMYLYAESNSTTCGPHMAMNQTVVTASSEIPAGTVLTREHLVEVEVPQKFLPPNPLLSMDAEIYVGMPITSHVQKGAMILTTDFGGLVKTSAYISKGKRVLKLSVKDFDGLPDGLRRGDRVDLLTTMVEGQTVVVSTPLQNITVFATGEDGSLTLSLTPEEVELVLQLRREAGLTFSARHRDEP